MDISCLLNEIKASNRYENQIVHIEDIPAREALYASLELKTQVKAALLGVGIEDLYSHQVEAIEKIREGKDVVLCTTTASGKSLTYMVSIFETVLDNPEVTALYISPLNTLVNDQLRNDETIISSISVTDIVFDVYLRKWNYRVIPKVKTWSYFLTIPKGFCGIRRDS